MSSLGEPTLIARGISFASIFWRFTSCESGVGVAVSPLAGGIAALGVFCIGSGFGVTHAASDARMATIRIFVELNIIIYAAYIAEVKQDLGWFLGADGMTLNRWQKLWMICSVVWGFVCVGSSVLLVIENLGDAPLAAYIAVASALVLAIWFLPLIAIYIFGWVIGWVAQGFRD